MSRKNSHFLYRLDDGVDDHAVLFLENMCNRQKVDNVTEDQFTISITVQVRDTNEILSGALIVNETFGIGINYSNTQIWVASYDIQIYTPVSGLFQIKLTHLQQNQL